MSATFPQFATLGLAQGIAKLGQRQEQFPAAGERGATLGAEWANASFRMAVGTARFGKVV